MATDVTLPVCPRPPLQVGISSCLMGDEVRYDGTGARSSFPHAALSNLFEYRAFCPEVGIGMGVPREPIHLVGSAGKTRVVAVRDASIDKTDALVAYARAQATGFDGLMGYIFMHNSPSCGHKGVKVNYPADGSVRREATGAYAAAIVALLPTLPVTDAGLLFNVAYRENFVSRTFIYAHWRMLRGITVTQLCGFHERYKYLLMAHSAACFERAEQLVQRLHNVQEELHENSAVADEYVGILMKGLEQTASRRGHHNVMMHLQAWLQKRIDHDQWQELSRVIEGYRVGEQPLFAPLALLKRHFLCFPDDYEITCSYLEPYPGATALENR